MTISAALQHIRAALVALQSQPPRVQIAVRLLEKVIGGLQTRKHK